MKDEPFEKRSSLSQREKGQYALAFSVVAVMLYFVGFPVFLVFFFGVLTFFIWKAFSGERHGGAKRIFDFYLNANEILREDDRRWFGFEVQEAIAKGESVLREMSSPPPLVFFALGLLYRKAGDHQSAARCLGIVAGENAVDESSVLFPAQAVRDYARLLRKIERAPREAPLTSAALFSLERLRKHRGSELLADSLARLSGAAELPQVAGGSDISGNDGDIANAYDFSAFARACRTVDGDAAERRSISEVLHDIYDEKAEG